MYPVSVAQSASVMDYTARCTISRLVTGLFAVLRTIKMIIAVTLNVTPHSLVQIHFFFFRKNNPPCLHRSLLLSCKPRQHILPKYRHLSPRLHGVIPPPPGRQDVTFIVTDVRASNCTRVYLFVSPNIKAWKRTHFRTVLKAVYTQGEALV